MKKSRFVGIAAYATMVLSIIAIYGIGCKKRGCCYEERTADDKQGDVVREVLDESPAGKVFEENADWLLVQGHESDDATAFYGVVRLGENPADSVSTSTTFSHPAMSLENRPENFVTVAARYADGWAVAEPVRGNPRRYQIVFRRINDDSGTDIHRVVKLEAARPTALHVVGKALYVGVGPKLVWFDLGEKTPRIQQLADRSVNGKAYDLFARYGDRLVGIDDEVEPYFADLIGLDSEGRPTHLADWELPGLVNGTYTHARLVPGKKKREYRLLMIAQYHVITGPGQLLAAFPIRNNELNVAKTTVLGRPEADLFLLAKESVHQAQEDKVQLIAGDEFTRWTGFEISTETDTVILTAGRRGLLAMEAKSSSGTRATLLPIGDCRDIMINSRGAFALVSKSEKETELVVLRETKGKTEVVGRHILKGKFHRFVR